MHVRLGGRQVEVQVAFEGEDGLHNRLKALGRHMLLQQGWKHELKRSRKY